MWGTSQTGAGLSPPVDGPPEAPEAVRPEFLSAGFRALPPFIGLVVLAIMAILYLRDKTIYFEVLDYLGVVPFRFPFVDTSGILSSIECWRHGLNVYRVNPCDVMGRTFNYSPLWLRLAIFPIGPSWRNAVGVTLGSAFFVSLLCLPPVRRPRQVAVIVLCSLSSASAFVIERGNFDIIMFVLAAVTGVLLQRRYSWRCLAYVLSLIAGLLKFYPLVLLMLALRERFRRFLMVVVMAGAVVVMLTFHFLPELREALSNVPTGSYFGGMFGAVNLPYGIVQSVALAVPILQGPLGHGLAMAGLFCLLGATAWTAGEFARSRGFSNSLAALDPANKIFMVIGAALCFGCFVAGQSVGYRAIHLIFVVPGLLALSGAAERSSRWIFRRALVIACFLMWNGTIRNVLPEMVQAGTGIPAGGLYFLLWLLRESCWWWLMAVFAGILVCFTLESTAWTVLGRLPILRQIDAVLSSNLALASGGEGQPRQAGLS